MATTHGAITVYRDVILNSVGCDSIITINLTVNSIDTSITNTSPTLTTNTSGASYQWLDCLNNMDTIPGEINQSFTAIQNGYYAVIISENGCSDTSTCHFIFSIGLNINEHNFNYLKFYPNPTSKNIVIDFGETKTNLTATLSNSLGQLISTYQFKTTKIINIDINSPSGIYFLQLVTVNGESTTLKIIKE